MLFSFLAPLCFAINVKNLFIKNLSYGKLFIKDITDFISRRCVCLSAPTFLKTRCSCRQIPVKERSESGQIASLAFFSPIERSAMNACTTLFTHVPSLSSNLHKRHRCFVLLSWILPLLIVSALLVQLYQLWLPRTVFAKESETITVADRKDFPDGRNIPQWMGSNGAFLYMGTPSPS